MNREKPFIRLFETQGGQYIFDVNTNAIIKIQSDVFDLLKEFVEDDSSIRSDALFTNYESDRTIKRLKEKGFLSSGRVKEVVNPVSDILESYMGSKLRMIILQLTQQCNLRCKYCSYSGNYDNRTHNNVKMSFETVKKGIEFLIDNSRDMDEVNVAFYGGEPLLEFEMMKKAILYAKEISEGKKLTFGFTTNGTLFTKEIIEFLMAYKVQIAISLDGPREVHDRNRQFAVSGCGTFEKVSKNLEFFRENYPEYFKTLAFNAVLDRKSSFGCINEFFANYETIKECLLMTSDVATQYAKSEGRPENEEYETQFSYELFKMYLSKLERLDDKHVSRLVTGNYDILNRIMIRDRSLKNGFFEKEHHGGPCVPGTQRLFVDVNGNMYPCERVSESSENMRIGHLDSGFDHAKIRNLMNFGKLTEDNCINCWAFRFCTVCAAFADDLDKLSAQKKLANCHEVKNTLDEQLKDFCMMKEFGYKFEDNNIFQVVEA